MEKDFSNIVINKLKAHFDVNEEVWSKCGKYRIDYVIRQKDSDVFFGIEFKDFTEKRGEEIGDHILQAMRYSVSEFRTLNSFKRIPIFLCPPISYKYLIMPEHLLEKNGKEYFADRHDKNFEHHTVNGMLGALNLGEVRTKFFRNKQYIYFSFSNKPIWSNEPYYQGGVKGLHEKWYPLLISKVNSFTI